MSSQKILEAAYDLFADNGYLATSLSQIAAKVGIKKPSIYSHFLCKDDLFYKVVDREVNDFTSYIDRGIEKMFGQSTRDKLLCLLETIIVYAYNDSKRINFWGNAIFFPEPNIRDEVKSKTADCYKRIYNIQYDIFIEGITNNNIKNYEISDLIYSFSGLIQGNLAMLFHNQMFTLDRARVSFEIFWEGIKKESNNEATD